MCRAPSPPYAPVVACVTSTVSATACRRAARRRRRSARRVVASSSATMIRAPERRQFQRDGATDAATGAGDDRHLSIQLHVHAPSSAYCAHCNGGESSWMQASVEGRPVRAPIQRQRGVRGQHVAGRGGAHALRGAPSARSMYRAGSFEGFFDRARLLDQRGDGRVFLVGAELAVNRAPTWLAEALTLACAR